MLSTTGKPVTTTHVYEITTSQLHMYMRLLQDQYIRTLKSNVLRNRDNRGHNKSLVLRDRDNRGHKKSLVLRDRDNRGLKIRKG